MCIASAAAKAPKRWIKNTTSASMPMSCQSIQQGYNVLPESQTLDVLEVIEVVVRISGLLTGDIKNGAWQRSTVLGFHSPHDLTQRSVQYTGESTDLMSSKAAAEYEIGNPRANT